MRPLRMTQQRKVIGPTSPSTYVSQLQGPRVCPPCSLLESNIPGFIADVDDLYAAGEYRDRVRALVYTISSMGRISYGPSRVARVAVEALPLAKAGNLDRSECHNVIRLHHYQVRVSKFTVRDALGKGETAKGFAPRDLTGVSCLFGSRLKHCPCGLLSVSLMLLPGAN